MSNGFKTLGFFTALYFVLLSGGVSAAGEWEYEGENGPSHWKDLPHCEACGGKKQSPVDLRKPFKKDLGGVDFKHYNRNLKDAKITNNGHTAQLSAIDAAEQQGQIRGGCMSITYYRFLQMHFHWGSDDTKGSEHTMDSKSFPMEGHLVHMNKKYDSLIEALDQEDGLAVLGVFFKLDSNDNADLKPIIDALQNITTKGSEAKIQENLNLQQLLPKDPNKYMCYTGSLTTPTCNEVVSWTVFTQPVPISEKQLNEFRKLHTGKNISSPLMSNNYRPVQKLEGRKIYLYDSATTVGLSGAYTVAALVAYFTYLSTFNKGT